MYAGLVAGFSGKIYPIDMDACVYIPTYTHSYTHIHTYTCIYTYIHSHTYTHAFTHAYVHTYIHMIMWHSLTQEGMPSKTRSL